MLSLDDRQNGMMFILQLEAEDAGLVTWVETLRGASAERWYDIYRRSDWGALRAEAGCVFHNRVTEIELQRVRKGRRRCVFIHTPAVKAEELAGRH